MSRTRPPVVLEAAMAAGVAAVFAAWSAATQQPTTSITWDAVQYSLVTSQVAAGQVPAAEAPYVYRLGTPWLVAHIWPSDPARGFLIVNIVSGLAAASLLSLWLRHGVERLSVRLMMVTLFAATWHGPIRYVHFNGGYVDPPFLVFVLLALTALQAAPRAAPFYVGVLTALTVAGTLVRETMLLVPISALLIGNPLWRTRQDQVARRPVRWILLWPVAAGITVIGFTHMVVMADTTRSFVAAALQWMQKPPSAYLLAWLTTYGPVLAVLMFDWRQVGRDLRDRQHLLAFLGLCAGLAFIGGSDTERFVFWAMPVVYLLIARAYERHIDLFASRVLTVSLVAAQAISARVFWAIPDPRVDPAPLGAGASLAERAYAVADRVLVIDHFHWNLWSSFGSQPFRLVRLGLYVTVAGALVWGMSRRSRAGVAR